jgi:hypothetical protein
VILVAIPAAMAGVCVAFGLSIWTTPPGAMDNLVAGRVVTLLGAICACLFCTAATTMRQSVGKVRRLDRASYPNLADVNPRCRIGDVTLLLRGSRPGAEDEGSTVAQLDRVIFLSPIASPSGSA